MRLLGCMVWESHFERRVRELAGSQGLVGPAGGSWEGWGHHGALTPEARMACLA